MFLNAPVASTAGCTPGVKTFGCRLRRRAKPCCWSALGALCLLAVLLPAQAQEVYYIHTDALGSPMAETDANRNVVKRYEYEPYGRRLNGSNDDKPGYTGHVMDAVTGLVQMQQRYYDPSIGAMLSVDPVTAYDQPITNFCRYCYANNNPYKFTDPDGRFGVPLPHMQQRNLNPAHGAADAATSRDAKLSLGVTLQQAQWERLVQWQLRWA